MFSDWSFAWSPSTRLQEQGGEPIVLSAAPAQTVSAPLPLISAAMYPTSLLSQLPQIPKFTGEDQPDGEMFQDWLEQFESVAELGKWDGHCKLVNLTTRLKGTAYSFYRSCSTEQRSSYPLLVAELKKRFTPVRLPAIQSQVFHERKQGPKESVDGYAQELRKLFSKAYAGIERGGPEAESLGRSVLANQFIAGLRTDLKAKVVGTEGDLDKLLVKARFEEAKKKELDLSRTTSSHPKKFNTVTSPNPSRSDSNSSGRSSPKNTPTVIKGACFNCGMPGHLARSCSYPKQPKGDKEAKGKKAPSVASVATEDSRQSKIATLRKQLQEEEIAAATEKASTTVHGVMSSSEDGQQVAVGPTITTKVAVNGLATDALVDTGSPVTIVSLEFMTQALLQEHKNYETGQEWSKAMLLRYKSPSISLKSYDGGRLNIVAEILVTLSRKGHSLDAVVFVQKDAPCDLLLGTDTLSALGLSLQLDEDEGMASLLGGGKIPPVHLAKESGEEVKGRASGEGAAVGDSHPSPTTGVIKLIEAVKIPARHKKMVVAKAKGWNHKELSLLTPKTDDPDIAVLDAVVQFEEGNCAVVIVENRSFNPKWLEKGMVFRPWRILL